MLKIILALFKMPIWQVILTIIIVGVLFKIIIHVLWLLIKKIFGF